MSSVLPHFQLPYEAKQAFLHHLRYLLRECTYLPDPAAREYIHNHILRRFREFRPRNSQDGCRPGQKWIKQKWIRNPQHVTKCMHECRSMTSRLYRASKGDRHALIQVLHDTYGRNGRRRHELLLPLLQPDIPKDSNQLEKPITKVGRAMLQLPRAVTLLGTAQAKQEKRGMKSTRSVGTFRKFLQPLLPAENNWGRPMPQKRINNRKREKWNELEGRLLPPLPKDEWERLKGLAAGKISCPNIPVRRHRLPGLPELPDVKEIHELTPRFMRRLWGSVFLQCPIMNRNEVNDEWNIVWGSLEDIKSGQLDASDEASHLFEDKRGGIVDFDPRKNMAN